MSHKRLLTVATIIASIILVVFVFSVPHTRDLPEEILTEDASLSVPEVALRDTYKKGLHTISGSIEVPDACTTASVQASRTGEASSTENILVEIFLAEDS